MNGHRRLKRTDLFLIRMWTEQDAGAGHGDVSWRGKVQRVVDGETYPFDDWQALVDVLQSLVSASNGGQTSSARNTHADQG